MHLKFTVLLFSLDRKVCEACNDTSYIVNTNGECVPCPEGSFPNGLRNKCFPCKAEEIILYDGSCKTCEESYVPSNNHKFCKPCLKNLVAKDGACQPCPDPNKE